MRLAILLAFAAFASVAHAETASCRRGVFERTRCDAVPVQPTAPAPLGGEAPAQPTASARPAIAPPQPAPEQQAVDPRLMSPYACNFAQKITLGPAVCQARNVAEAHRHVGELVAGHRCDEAVKAAQATGDGDFAGRVREFCVSPVR